MKTLINRLTFFSIAIGLTSLAVQVAQASSNSVNSFDSINLGPAADYSVLGLSGASGHGSIINLSSGPLRINGNVGVGDNGKLNFSGGGQIIGRTDFAASAVLNTGANTITGGTHQQDFSSIGQAVQSTVDTINALSPTQTFSSITNPISLTGNGGLNVISIGQNIHLSGGNLTLNGSASDVFVFKISGTMELSGNTNIVLNGGVTAGNVIWDFIGFGSQFQTSGQSQTAGIFLAPQRVININGGIHNSEFISGVSLSFQSNPVIVPEASTTALLIFGGLIAIGVALRRRTKAA